MEEVSYVYVGIGVFASFFSRMLYYYMATNGISYIWNFHFKKTTYWFAPFPQGRWGKVHKGRWHGEVAIRLLEIDGNNQGHLKLFKKEVMNYRQTRHENVVLFMGACMHPPHLAIITRLVT